MMHRTMIRIIIPVANSLLADVDASDVDSSDAKKYIHLL